MGSDGHGAGHDLLAETEDQASLRQLAREVAEREVAPRAHDADEAGFVPPEMRKALAASDLLRITVGEQLGRHGPGRRRGVHRLGGDRPGRRLVGHLLPADLQRAAPGIEHLGPEAMKERWLPAVADGDALISIGITEPDAGSAVQNMRAALVEDGPGRWRLNAYKNYSTLGDVAQGVLVWCRWPGGEGAKGIGAVIVPTDREGVSVTGRHKGMGIHAATEAELAFDGVEITADDILIAGDPADTEAFKVLLSHLNHERCGNASMCVGAAQGALEHAVRYMNERVIGGRPLADLQGLQWKLADMAVQLEGARLLLARAVRLAGPHGHAAAPRDGHGQDGGQPGRQVRVRRGHADPRRLRLLARVPARAGLPRHPGPVLRGRDRRGPAQLHRPAGGRRGAHGVTRLEGRAGLTAPDRWPTMTPASGGARGVDMERHKAPAARAGVLAALAVLVGVAVWVAPATASTSQSGGGIKGKAGYLVYWDQNEEVDFLPMPSGTQGQLLRAWDLNGQMCVLPDGRFVGRLRPDAARPAQPRQPQAVQATGRRRGARQPERRRSAGQTLYVPGPYKMPGQSIGRTRRLRLRGVQQQLDLHRVRRRQARATCSAPTSPRPRVTTRRPAADGWSSGSRRSYTTYCIVYGPTRAATVRTTPTEPGGLAQPGTMALGPQWGPARAQCGHVERVALRGVVVAHQRRRSVPAACTRAARSRCRTS